jgi:lipopolysaccharide transport system permease protein
LLKWLLDPYLLVGVYLLLVVFLLDRGGDAPGLSLACAIVPFQVVTATVINAMSSVALRGSIILNMSFRRGLLPVSSTLTECVAFGASLSLLALMMLIYAIPLTSAILWFPLAVAATLLVAAAFAYPATLFGLWFADLRPFAVSFMRILFFLAPGLIPLSEISGAAGEIVRLNPLSGLFEAYRDALQFGQAPALWELAIPVGFALLALSVFVPIYRREQRQFAKLL